MRYSQMASVLVSLFISYGNGWGHTYYASPGGGGDGSSRSSPFKVADFWHIAQPDDTLLLLNGRYTGVDSMIIPPQHLSGKPDKPITIRAQNDGKAEIDGEPFGHHPDLYLIGELRP